VLSHAFSEKALRDLESFVDLNARRLVKVLGENVGADGWTETKDFSAWATFYGFDFTGDLAFGESFGMMEDEENRYFPAMLKGTSWFLYFVSAHLILTRPNIPSI